MNENKEKIDFLLERNTAERMAGVDWAALNTEISARLDQAEKSKTPFIRRQIIFKAAAGIAAAAVVLIAVMVGTNRPAGLQINNGKKAAVEIIDGKGTASIEIKTAAKCDVKIMDLNGGLEKDYNRGTWIIISAPKPVLADNGKEKEAMSIIYLF